MSDSDEIQRAAALAFEEAAAQRAVAAEELREHLTKQPIVGGVQYVAQPAPGWDVPGLWHCFGTAFRSGYAAAAVSLQWIITNRIGIRMQLVPHRTADIDIEKFPADRYDTLFAWTKETVGIPRALICTYPLEIASEMSGAAPLLVPYVAFEGTKISDYGKRLCERGLFQRVWVMSEFIRSAYLAAGVAPELVRTVSPMLCGGPWPMPPLNGLVAARSRPVTSEDPYVFATVGTWTKRKGMHDLVRAYFSDFKRNEPVLLTIRTSAFGTSKTIREMREEIAKELEPIAAEFGTTLGELPRLHFELGTKPTDVELIEWLGTIDCYVNPSYGEGVGIPQTWAKALGVPLVSTGFGSVGDMMREVRLAGGGRVDQTIDYTLARVDPVMLRLGLMYARDTEWGVYDPVAFGAGMRRAMVEGRVTDIHGAAYVRSRFGEDEAVASLSDALEELLSESLVAELKDALHA